MLALFGCVLLLRLAVPSGWMPVVDATGTHLTICTGMGPIAGPAHAAYAAHAMAHHDMPAGHDHSQGDHSCPFAGFACSLAVPFAPVPDLWAPASAVPASAIVIAVAVGRGLASPPPPATGPPLLA